MTEDDVSRWRTAAYTDHCLLHLMAFGAMVAIDHIESAVTGRPSTH
ncbi:hypothetical protein GCM10022226_28050 [Sphaerisporangium flaviroseum]|uniref:Uncharacterized protein n=1 Tax=Sphaerisporangium flaviroseum TaxID=509199 RepID=A0ABP7HWU6_9ACTN